MSAIGRLPPGSFSTRYLLVGFSGGYRQAACDQIVPFPTIPPQPSNGLAWWKPVVAYQGRENWPNIVRRKAAFG